MKKRKINLTKQFKFIILCFGLSFLFQQCANDDFINLPNIEKQQFSLKNKNFDELKYSEKFNIAHQEIERFASLNNSKKNFKNKNSATNDIYNFSIDSSSIKEIKLKNYTSYTFFIKREHTNSSFFENLVISIDSTNKPKATLFKYFPSQPMEKVENHNTYTFKGKVKSFNLEYSKIKQYQSKSEYVCQQVTRIYCTNEGYENGKYYNNFHIAEESCFKYDLYHLVTQTKTECSFIKEDDYFGGPSGTDDVIIDDFDTPTGGGGGGNTNTDPLNNNNGSVVTTPNFMCDNIDGNCIENNLESTLNKTPSILDTKEQLFTYIKAVGVYTNNNPEFSELSALLFNYNTNINLPKETILEVSLKAKEILTILNDNNFANIDQLSLEEQKTIAKNSLFIGFIPNLKDLGIDLPQTAEEWKEFGEFLITVLIELIPELIPGVSELNSLKNAISAFNNGSYTDASTELAFAIVGVFPVGKAWKIATKTFKGMKIVVRLTKAFKNAKKLRNLISSNYDEALNAFNKVGVAGNEGVRVLTNSTEKHGKTFFEQLTKNIPKETIQGTNGPIIKATFPDGSKIQFRDWATQSDGVGNKATIEFLGGNYTKKIQKIKFNE